MSESYDLKCLRCGNTWVKKFEENPKTCPSCKSPYWDKPMSHYWKTRRELNKRKKLLKNK